MTGRMQWLGFLLAATTAACVADDAEVADTEQALSHERADAERVLCIRDACLLTYDHDSDGDGVSDLDERALGTDPFDPASRPLHVALIELAIRDALPSLELGHSMIVILPTQDPRGMPVLGGREALPGRNRMIERMGISRDALSGLDPSKGLSLFRRPGSGPRFGVRGLGFSLVGRGDGGLSSDVRNALERSANRDHGIERVEQGPGTATIQRFNGSSDVVTWSSGHTWLVSRDRHGNQTQSVHTRTTTRSDAGGNTTTTRTSTSKTAKETSTRTETRTTSSEGRTATDRTWDVETHNDNGTSTHEKGSSSTAPDGQTHETVVTTTCSGDDCTTKVTESDPPAQTCGVTIDCEGGGGNAYADPDSAFAPSVMTTEGARTALIVLGATIHTIEPDGGSVDFQPDPKRADRWGPVSLVADEAAIGGVLIFRGNNIAGPEFDPDLPQPEVGPPGPEPCTTCN